MLQILKTVMLLLAVRLQTKPRDERGASAVDWLIITGAGIGIAYFAGDSVMTFAKSLVGGLGGGE